MRTINSPKLNSENLIPFINFIKDLMNQQLKKIEDIKRSQQNLVSNIQTLYNFIAQKQEKQKFNFSILKFGRQRFQREASSQNSYPEQSQQSVFEKGSQQQFDKSIYKDEESLLFDEKPEKQRQIQIFSEPMVKDFQKVSFKFQKLQIFNERMAKQFQKMNLKFKNAQLLYHFPENKDINFHDRIDKKDNIFLSIHLENNNEIGVFTHVCFDPKRIYIPQQNPKSFICNMTKGIFLFPQKINKTHTYDSNYLTFGNWQIKIKNGAYYLESQLGTVNDCYSKDQFDSHSKYDQVSIQNINIRQKFFSVPNNCKKIFFHSYQIFQLHI